MSYAYIQISCRFFVRHVDRRAYSDFIHDLVGVSRGTFQLACCDRCGEAPARSELLRFFGLDHSYRLSHQFFDRFSNGEAVEVDEAIGLDTQFTLSRRFADHLECLVVGH